MKLARMRHWQRQFAQLKEQAVLGILELPKKLVRGAQGAGSQRVTGVRKVFVLHNRALFLSTVKFEPAKLASLAGSSLDASGRHVEGETCLAMARRNNRALKMEASARRESGSSRRNLLGAVPGHKRLVGRGGRTSVAPVVNP